MIINHFPFPSINRALLQDVSPAQAARALTVALSTAGYPNHSAWVEDGLLLTAKLFERVVKESLISAIQTSLSRGENIGQAISNAEWSWQLSHWHALLVLLQDQPELFDQEEPTARAALAYFSENPAVLPDLRALLDELCASQELAQGADRQVGGEWPPMVHPGPHRALEEHVAWHLYTSQQRGHGERLASQDQQLNWLYEAMGEARRYHLLAPTKKGRITNPTLDNVIPLSAARR